MFSPLILIRDIGHGVRLCDQKNVESKTLVCFLDRNGVLHFGFGYKNGSNFLVVCWEDNGRRNRSVPKGALIIAFVAVVTQNSFRHNFTADDFQFQWLDVNAQNNVRDDLIALKDKEDRVADITARLAGLTIQQLDVVIQKIDELQGNN